MNPLDKSMNWILHAANEAWRTCKKNVRDNFVCGCTLEEAHNNIPFGMENDLPEEICIEWLCERYKAFFC